MLFPDQYGTRDVWNNKILIKKDELAAGASAAALCIMAALVALFFSLSSLFIAKIFKDKNLKWNPEKKPTAHPLIVVCHVYLYVF